MGMNLDTLTARLRTKNYYPVLFKNAFGDTGISSRRISLALSQFVRSIISYRSKFDTGRSSVPPGLDPIQTFYANFTAEENLGKQLFFSPQTACATCHGTETFSAPGDRNNGLDNPSVDLGVGGISNIPQHLGNFKRLL
jgi:cytochrome c peroxidase